MACSITELKTLETGMIHYHTHTEFSSKGKMNADYMLTTTDMMVLI